MIVASGVISVPVHVLSRAGINCCTCIRLRSLYCRRGVLMTNRAEGRRLVGSAMLAWRLAASPCEIAGVTAPLFDS